MIMPLIATNSRFLRLNPPNLSIYWLSHIHSSARKMNPAILVPFISMGSSLLGRGQLYCEITKKIVIRMHFFSLFPLSCVFLLRYALPLFAVL